MQSRILRRFDVGGTGLDLSHHAQGISVIVVLEIAAMISFGALLLRHKSFLIGQAGRIETFFRQFLKKYFQSSADRQLQILGLGSFQRQAWREKRWRLLMISFFSGCLLVALTGSFFWIALPVFSVLLQFYTLLKQTRTRKEKMLKRIPFVLDILTLNLEAGLDFVTSLEELTRIPDDHPLYDEIKIALRSVQMGETRAQAFQNLGARTQIQELSDLAFTIRQSETMGSSLAELLRLQSHEIRYRIFKRAESEAQKTPVKILIPMLLLIFPVVFVLLFVPIGIQLFESFQ
jgi:tight adherence protein C